MNIVKIRSDHKFRNRKLRVFERPKCSGNSRSRFVRGQIGPIVVGRNRHWTMAADAGVIVAK